MQCNVLRWQCRSPTLYRGAYLIFVTNGEKIQMSGIMQHYMEGGEECFDWNLPGQFLRCAILQGILDDATVAWGIKVERVEM